MRINLLIKILLAISCFYFSIRIIYVNGQIDKSISEKYTVLSKLRGVPSLDTAENRKRYQRKKGEINKQIDSLREKKYPNWCRFLAVILAPIAGWQLRSIYSSVFKKPAT